MHILRLLKNQTRYKSNSTLVAQQLTKQNTTTRLRPAIPSKVPALIKTDKSVK